MDAARGVWRVAARVGTSSVFLGALLAAASWPGTAASLAPYAGLDGSWQAAMAMAAHQHLPFGTQVIWTYGPLGFLTSGQLYYAGTAIVAFLFKLAPRDRDFHRVRERHAALFAARHRGGRRVLRRISDRGHVVRLRGSARAHARRVHTAAQPGRRRRGEPRVVDRIRSSVRSDGAGEALAGHRDLRAGRDRDRVRPDPPAAPRGRVDPRPVRRCVPRGLVRHRETGSATSLPTCGAPERPQAGIRRSRSTRRTSPTTSCSPS